MPKHTVAFPKENDWEFQDREAAAQAAAKQIGCKAGKLVLVPATTQSRAEYQNHYEFSDCDCFSKV